MQTHAYTLMYAHYRRPHLRWTLRVRSSCKRPADTHQCIHSQINTCAGACPHRCAQRTSRTSRTTRHDTTRHVTHDTVCHARHGHSTARHGTAQHGMAWHGMARTHACMHAHTHARTHSWIRARLCAPAHTYTHILVPAPLHMRPYTCTCSHACMHTHTHTHTHTRTQACVNTRVPCISVHLHTDVHTHTITRAQTRAHRRSTVRWKAGRCVGFGARRLVVEVGSLSKLALSKLVRCRSWPWPSMTIEAVAHLDTKGARGGASSQYSAECAQGTTSGNNTHVLQLSVRIEWK